MKRILFILLILLVSTDGFSQRKVRWQDLTKSVQDSIQAGGSSLSAGSVNWSHLASAIQDSITSRAKDSLFIAASNSSFWDKKKAHVVVSGNADDEISAVMGRVTDGSYVRILPGDYTVTNNTEGTVAIKCPRKDNYVVDASGATITLADNENVFIVEVDSAVDFAWIGGVLKGNPTNQTNGGGIKLKETTRATILSVRIDSVRTHSTQVEGTIDTKILFSHMNYSFAGRGVDVEWESSTDTENRGLLVMGCTMKDHGFGTMKVENSWETAIVGNFLYGREPESSGINCIILDNNDAAADTMLAVLIADNVINGGNQIFIQNSTGMISIRDNIIYDTYVAISDSNTLIRVASNEFFPEAGDESRIIDAASDRVGKIEFSYNECHGDGSIAEAVEVEGEGQFVALHNTFYNFSSGIFEIHSDSAIISGNIMNSTGGHGASELAIEIRSNYNDISDNHIRNFFRPIILVNADSNRIAGNFIMDATANADTAISERGSSDYNIIRDNHIPGIFARELNINGANSWKLDNYGLQAATRRNTFPLVMDAAALVNFEGHVEMDSSLTVEDTIWLGSSKTNPVLSTNGGGENTRLGADDKIQLIPKHDTQNVDFIQIEEDGGNVIISNNGAPAVWIGGDDHLSPWADSLQALGHNANKRFGHVGLTPTSYSHFETNLFIGKCGLIDSDNDGDPDSLAVGISLTSYGVIGWDRVVTAPGP